VGHDPSYGARPLKRTIQREVETPIAKGILGSLYPPHSTLLLDAKPGDAKISIMPVMNTSAISAPMADAVADAGAGADAFVSNDGNFMQ
jgi:hypothetical protein